MTLPTQDARRAGALFGSLIGDALALGTHWIYNPSKIARLHGRITGYIDPAGNQYHAAKSIGEFTHYGDQTMELLRSLERGQGFSAEAFRTRWTAMWPDYRGYVDGATKSTLATGGSGSNDLAGAGRIAPLLVAIQDQTALEEAAAAQTALTHGDPGVVEAAVFFARVTRKVLAGATPGEALDSVAADEWTHIDPAGAVAAALAGLDEDTTAALQARGLTCHLPEAFPGTIYLILKYAGSIEEALIANTMAGGDSAARGLLVGLVLGAHLGIGAIPDRWIAGLAVGDEIRDWLAGRSCDCDAFRLRPGTNKFEFPNGKGEMLAGRLEWPASGNPEPRAVAIFAHCFTCSKDIPAAARISRALADAGIAVLRFDFTGLGGSGGDFANTNFSSNVEDLVAAARRLEETVGKPTLLIGHSLGGAAVLAATRDLPAVKGVVTIGAPSDPSHVSRLFEAHVDTIVAEGEARVSLAGREFTIQRQFLEDIREGNILERLRDYRGALLVLHAPSDETVGIGHAGQIYTAARHPKSFVALAGADHLLTRPEHARFAATMIAAWASQFG